MDVGEYFLVCRVWTSQKHEIGIRSLSIFWKRERERERERERVKRKGPEG